MKQIEYLWKMQELEKKEAEEKIKLTELKESKHIQQKIVQHKQLKKRHEKILQAKEGILNESMRVEHQRSEFMFKIKEIKEKLYDGSIQDTKQLEILLKEQQKLEKIVDDIDTNLIEMMEKIDGLEEKIKKYMQKDQVMGKDINNQLKGRKKKIKNLEESIEKIELELQNIKDKIDVNNMKIYESIQARRKDAVCNLEEGVCKGCHISLPVLKVKEVKTKDIVFCSNCGRILRYIEKE